MAQTLPPLPPLLPSGEQASYSSILRLLKNNSIGKYLYTV
jgi:hypothetical protein